ncbi:MAG: hypothetical protein ABI199_03720 [Bacteroidia bacterium]
MEKQVKAFLVKHNVSYVHVNVPYVHVNVSYVQINVPYVQVNVSCVHVNVPYVHVNVPKVQLNMPYVQLNMSYVTVYGKIKEVVRTASSALPDLAFNYDPSGNRISKVVKPHGSSKENGGTDEPLRWTYTYYVRDAQGNELVVYQQKLDTVGTNISLSYKETERNIYGSSRLGTEVGATEMIGALPLTNIDTINHYLGNIHYEAANHLGNVLSVFTDKKIPIQSLTNPMLIASYEPDILSSTDYYPFGAPLYSRNFNNTAFRFGFNGMEKDNDIYGTGNAYTTEFRMLDTRLGGRWWSLDPDIKPWESPYAGFSDNPIVYSDPFGKDITNPGKYVLSNKALIQKLKAFDIALSAISGRDIHSYKIPITGGDRYRDKDGKIRSRSNGGIIGKSASQSRHLQENGALAVDLATGGWDLKTLEKAAKKAGLRINPDGEPYTDGHFHLDMGLGKNADEAKKVYDASNPDKTQRPTDKDLRVNDKEAKSTSLNNDTGGYKPDSVAPATQDKLKSPPPANEQIKQ